LQNAPEYRGRFRKVWLWKKDWPEARASEGEMVTALQQVFGRYTESPVF
jgi:hypothetical protein